MIRKKITGILLAGMLIVSCSACTQKESPVQDSDAPKQEKLSNEELSAQIESLTVRVEELEGVIDKFYAGSEAAQQMAGFSIEDISYETVDFEDRVLFVLHNNGTEPVIGLKVLMTFYNAGGEMLDSEEAYMEVTQPGAFGVVSFASSRSAFEDVLSYDHYEVELIKEPYSFSREFFADETFALTVDKTTENDLMVKVENLGESDVDIMVVTAIFYKEGSVVGYNTNTITGLQAGAYTTTKLYGAVNQNEEAAYDTYEVKLSSVYSYQ